MKNWSVFHWVNTLASVALLLLVYAAREHFPEAFGGSLSLVVLSSALVAISFYPEFLRVAASLSLLVLSVLALNYFNFLQTTRNFHPDLNFYVYNAIVFMFMLVLGWAFGRVIGKGEKKGDSTQASAPFRRNRWIFISRTFPAFAFSLAISLVFWVEPQARSIASVQLPMVATSFIAVPVCLMVMVISLLTSYRRRQLVETNKPYERDVSVLKSWWPFWGLMIFVLFTGTILEALTRKQFVLWFESLAAVYAALCLIGFLLIYTGKTNMHTADREFVVTPLALLGWSVIISILASASFVILGLFS
jgi:hypothetical protein